MSFPNNRNGNECNDSLPRSLNKFERECTPRHSFLCTVSPPQEREIVFLPPPLEEESLPGDLFSVLFKCEAHDTPWRALLAHCIALQRPLLAILAACYTVGICVLSLHSLELIPRINNILIYIKKNRKPGIS